MSFWNFCEKVSGFVGDGLVIIYIRSIRTKWAMNCTVQNTVEYIQSESERK